MLNGKPFVSYVSSDSKKETSEMLVKGIKVFLNRKKERKNTV